MFNIAVVVFYNLKNLNILHKISILAEGEYNYGMLLP